MSLQLVNAYTSENLGDAAIYETITQLAGPMGASTCLPPERIQNVRGLRAAAGVPGAWVSVGGDIFNNARAQLVTRRFLRLVGELSHRDPRHGFVFGQGLPSSCRGPALAWLARAMRRLSSVTVRDGNSHQRLMQAGVDADLGYDTVFAYRPAFGVLAAARAAWSQAGVEPARAVVFSVRQFDAMYPHDGALFEARLVQLVQALRQRGHQPVMVVQSRAEGADTDAAVLQRLRGQLGYLPLLDPFAVSALGHHPLDALVGVLGQAAAVVAVRYHTAVLRMLAGRAPYNLFYSSKGQDLVTRLRMPGQSLADFDPSQVVREVEASMGTQFHIEPVARMVRQQFHHALSRAARGF
jgi:polysaccharide pyruvyl transferase WcaK-like protein